MRVNMDSSVASDPRFKLVALALSVSNREVYGSCYLLWLACYERRSERLRKVEADVAAELSGFADALVAEGLADDCGDGTVIVHGVTKRIEFLKKQAERGSKGGKSKKKPKAQANAKQTLVQTPSTAVSTAQAYTPTPTLTPTPESALARPSAGDREVSLMEIASVYERYPLKKGKKEGMAKASKLIRTRADFDRFKACVEHMARSFRGDTTYCPHFSTFVNGRLWEDDDWPSPSEPKKREQDITVGHYKHTGDEEYGSGKVEDF